MGLEAFVEQQAEGKGHRLGTWMTGGPHGEDAFASCVRCARVAWAKGGEIGGSALAEKCPPYVEEVDPLSVYPVWKGGQLVKVTEKKG